MLYSWFKGCLVAYGANISKCKNQILKCPDLLSTSPVFGVGEKLPLQMCIKSCLNKENSRKAQDYILIYLVLSDITHLWENSYFPCSGLILTVEVLYHSKLALRSHSLQWHLHEVTTRYYPFISYLYLPLYALLSTSKGRGMS